MAPKRHVTYSSRPNHAARSAHARGDKMFRTYDTSAIQPKKSKAPLVAFIVILLVIVLAVGFFVFNKLTAQETNPNLITSEQTATITVNDGDGAYAIANTLYDAGLINSKDEFVSRVTALEADTKLKPGTYTISGGLSVDEIISTIKAGPGMTGNTLTIPEGYKLSDIAQAVETATDGRISASEFSEAAADASVYASEYSFLADAGTNSLEGFLFPKTYVVEDEATAQDLIRLMLSQYQQEIASLDFSYPSSQGLSNYDALILASIVEKESTTNTRSTVASVFYNRLTTDGAPTYGLLQSDATTAYEVGHDPTAEEVHSDSAYSTYTNKGLPPTPICSPSLESLQAVCNPDSTNYYYFYFAEDADGVMQYYFSETYEDHQEAINQ
jgi:UPF0755 protein